MSSSMVPGSRLENETAIATKAWAKLGWNQVQAAI